MKASDKKIWYVQPEDGAWVDGVFQKQNATVLMTDDAAKYLVMASILGDKPVAPVTAAAPETADQAEPPAKPAKKGGPK